jgi:hypothetical protein
MATFNKLNGFVEHLAEGVHNLGSNQIMVALSNTAGDITTANASTAACVLASVTQISYTNLSGATPRNVTTTSSAQTSGTYKLVLQDLVLTATGAVGPFRYVFLYNDTPTSPADPLIGYYDYTSSISLATGETFTIDFDDANGVLTLA